MKMDSLAMLFDREKQAMTNHCQRKYKIKKNKHLHIKLATMDDNKRKVVLSEYFDACKMVYRIKATVNYTWNLEKNLDQVIDLF